MLQERVAYSVLQAPSVHSDVAWVVVHIKQAQYFDPNLKSLIS